MVFGRLAEPFLRGIQKRNSKARAVIATRAAHAGQVVRELVDKGLLYPAPASWAENDDLAGATIPAALGGHEIP